MFEPIHRVKEININLKASLSNAKSFLNITVPARNLVSNQAAGLIRMTQADLGAKSREHQHWSSFHCRLLRGLSPIGLLLLQRRYGRSHLLCAPPKEWIDGTIS